MQIRPLLCAVPLFLAGCATAPQPASKIPPPPPYVQTLAAKGVAPQTMKRIVAARVLTFADVLELVKKGVPGDKIVAYMKATRAPYAYTQAQVNALTAAGADSTLVNFVGRADGDFMIDAQNEPQQRDLLTEAKLQKEMIDDPYFMDEAYWGPPPFAFGWPALWY